MAGPGAAMCLCFVVDGPWVLLGHKRTGLGAGNIVGLGGHVDAGETPREAAAREAREESGLAVAAADLTPAGTVYFRFPQRPEWDQWAAVFTTGRWQGTPRPCEEIEPEWFDVAALPVDRMWADARHWLPRVLAGEQVHGRFVFNPDNRTLASAVVVSQDQRGRR